MKKVLASLTLGMLLVAPAMALAQSDAGDVAQDSTDVYKIINSVINWAFAILLIGAVFVIIMAAFLFLTSAGDEDKVKKARNYILYAIVAIVVAFLAKALIFFVAEMIGVENPNFF
jgi:hypothetical protein